MFQPLLHTLAVPGQPPVSGKVDFKTAMGLLNLASVFDVIRLSKTQFVEQLAVHCDDDGAQAYDLATGYAAQLDFLHREQGVSYSDNQPVKRTPATDLHIRPTYAALFEENWHSYCSAASPSALDSPAAYLRALYLFAQQIESSGKGISNRVTLAIRRPLLKNLIIDNQSLTQEIPLLSIVNETLSEHLNVYISQHTDIYKSKTVNEVLAVTLFPFELPFDLAHQQCLLGLTGNKPALGELSYRLSLKLPLANLSNNIYGVIQHPAYEAQRLLSGLSPQQQILLSSPLWIPGKAFFKTHYASHEETLKKLDSFMLQTGLTADQVDELLARNKYQPKMSRHINLNALERPENEQDGARYVNGPQTDNPLRLGLETDVHGKAVLLNTSPARFDRLQRMIRLQRWLGISFTQLDTLLWSAMQCEQSTNNELLINDNTLRMLGVYRYLNLRYGLKAEEFSALLYQLPVHACGNSDSLFDRVFNRRQLFNHPLQLDGSPLDPDAGDPSTHTTVYQVCAALGLSPTTDSLGLAVAQTRKYMGTLGRNLNTFSSFYRQARIASLFGLSVMESVHLIELLGDGAYTKNLVKPFLRSSGQNAPADFLDALMQMDWAVSWINASGSSVQQIHHQLLLDSAPQKAIVSEQLADINALFDDLQNRLIPQEQIDALNLPQAEAGAPPLPYSWSVLLVKGILKGHSQLPRIANQETLKRGLAAAVNTYVTMSANPETNHQLKTEVTDKLERLLLAAYELLQPFRDKAEHLFKDTSHVSQAPILMRHTIKHVIHKFGNALGRPSTSHIFKHLLLLLTDAENTLELPLSRQALQSLLLNPHWLDNEHAPGSMLKLSFSTLYLFKQFHKCINVYGLTQDMLLGFFQTSNPTPIVGESSDLSSSTNTLLAAIFNWDVQEIKVLVNRLQTKRVSSMVELDWLMRCHEAAITTGLSANVLLTATDLHAEISNSDWGLVGKAVIATQEQ